MFSHRYLKRFSLPFKSLKRKFGILNHTQRLGSVSALKQFGVELLGLKGLKWELGST